jgi:hypothetical protein
MKLRAPLIVLASTLIALPLLASLRTSIADESQTVAKATSWSLEESATLAIASYDVIVEGQVLRSEASRFDAGTGGCIFVTEIDLDVSRAILGEVHGRVRVLTIKLPHSVYLRPPSDAQGCAILKIGNNSDDDPPITGDHGLFCLVRGERFDDAPVLLSIKGGFIRGRSGDSVKICDGVYPSDPPMWDYDAYVEALKDEVARNSISALARDADVILTGTMGSGSVDENDSRQVNYPLSVNHVYRGTHRVGSVSVQVSGETIIGRKMLNSIASARSQSVMLFGRFNAAGDIVPIGSRLVYMDAEGIVLNGMRLIAGALVARKVSLDEAEELLQ